MGELLKGKRGIITGVLDEKSIAYCVAKRCIEEGAHIVISNTVLAARLGKVKEICERWGVPFIPADLTNLDDIKKLFDESVKNLGGSIDFILHSVAMSGNVRRRRPYLALDYPSMVQALDVSAISLHKMLSVAHEMNVLSEWGSVVTISYIASERTFPGYSDMAEAKALLESIVRSCGYHLGVSRKVRVNAVSQSPVPTTAGSGISGFDIFYRYADDMSPLGNAPAEACANLCVFLFSDMSRYITMQVIYCDGGFSRTGISEKIIAKYMNGG